MLGRVDSQILFFFQEHFFFFFSGCLGIITLVLQPAVELKYVNMFLTLVGGVGSMINDKQLPGELQRRWSHTFHVFSSLGLETFGCPRKSQEETVERETVPKEARLPHLLRGIVRQIRPLFPPLSQGHGESITHSTYLLLQEQN